MNRRRVLFSLLPAPLAPLRFPVDFGAHPDTHTEWGCLTDELQFPQGAWGFQVT